MSATPMPSLPMPRPTSRPTTFPRPAGHPMVQLPTRTTSASLPGGRKDKLRVVGRARAKPNTWLLVHVIGPCSSACRLSKVCRQFGRDGPHAFAHSGRSRQACCALGPEPLSRSNVLSPLWRHHNREGASERNWYHHGPRAHQCPTWHNRSHHIASQAPRRPLTHVMPRSAGKQVRDRGRPGRLNRLHSVEVSPLRLLEQSTRKHSTGDPLTSWPVL